MILSYSHFRFKPAIIYGIKKHSLRVDASNRWKAGMSIQHWMFSPRHPHKNPHPFSKEKYNVCTGTEDVILYHQNGTIQAILVNGKKLSKKKMQELACNDGFQSLREMSMFFFGFTRKREYWKGKIIHWTDLRYGKKIKT